MATHPIRFGIQTGQQGVAWEQMLGALGPRAGDPTHPHRLTHFIFMIFAPYFVEEIQAFAEQMMPKVRGA